MRILRILSGGAITAGMLLASGFELAGPLTGVVYTPASRSLRPILGFPGGAYMGASILGDLDWAAVSPSGDRVLARGPQGLALLSGLGAGEPSVLQLAAPEGEITTGWSRDSDSVAVLYHNERRMHVLQLDGDSWSRRDVEIPSGEVRGLALAPDGFALLAISGGDGPALWLADPQLPRRIPLPGTPASLALVRQEQDALVLDESGGQLYWIQDFRGAAAVVPVAFPEGEVTVSSVADAGGDRILALGREHRRAWIYDLPGGRITAEAQLDWLPENARPLAQPSLFVAGGAASAGEPLYILSTRSGLEAFFVPQTPE